MCYIQNLFYGFQIMYAHRVGYEHAQYLNGIHYSNLQYFVKQHDPSSNKYYNVNVHKLHQVIN